MSTTATLSPTADLPSASRGPAAVSIEGVSKTFRLPHQQYSTLKQHALHPFRSTDYDELHAVKDVSLKIATGSSLGSSGATAAARARC